MNMTPAQDESNAVKMKSVQQMIVLSWGERLLPYLFAAIETCCIDAVLIGLASFSFLPLLVPLWSPFVFIASFYFLATYRNRSASVAGVNTSSFGMLIVTVLILFCVLFILWSAAYASSFPFTDVHWLASTFTDLFLLSANAFHSVGVLVLIAYCCWRGVRLHHSTSLFRSELESENILSMLRIGLGILLVVICLRAVHHTQTNEFALLLLIPIFLAFVLLAHSFSQATVLRHSHPHGFQGGVRVQEKSLLFIVVGVGLLLLLVSLLVNAITVPLFGYIAALLAWLLQLLQIHPQASPPRKIVKFPKKTEAIQYTPNDALLRLIAHITELVLIIIVVTFILVTIYWLTHRKYRNAARSQSEKDEDVHESVWSWMMFWMQVRAFFSHLSFHLFPVRHKARHHSMREKLVGEFAIHSIREIYRTLLYWSASRGIVRNKFETPQEFRSRLYRRLPYVEPELGIVTDAYIEVRYGLIVLDEREVARVRGAWMRLRQKK